MSIDVDKRNAELQRICAAVVVALPSAADPMVLVDALALVFVSLGRQVLHSQYLVERVVTAINTLARSKELRAELDASDRIIAARPVKPPVVGN